MTRRELFEGCLYIYNQALESVKESQTYTDVQDALYAYGVLSGVCTCMAHNFASNSDQVRDNYILVSDIIQQYTDDDSPFWGKTPGGEQKESVISCLEYRIEILTEILNQTN